MIGGVVWLRPAGRVTQMVGELAAQGPLDNRLLEAPDGGLQLLVRYGPLADELVENLG